MPPIEIPKGYTPGGWAAFTDDSGARPHTNIVSFVPVTACVFSLPGHDKRDPNVQLIAKAPDMAARIVELEAALTALEMAEAAYRYAYEHFGAADMRTGRAWDWLKRDGDKARALIPVDPRTALGEGS